jgi:hypothetical protein
MLWGATDDNVITLFTYGTKYRVWIIEKQLFVDLTCDWINQPAGTVAKIAVIYVLIVLRLFSTGFAWPYGTVLGTQVGLFAGSVHRRFLLRNWAVEFFDHIQHALRDFADLAGRQK